MAGEITGNHQCPEVSNSQSQTRMKFWGVCCVGGKAYKQVVNYRFHLTMAVLDPKSYDREVRDRLVTLSVIQHGQIFLLCVLKHGEIQQVNLNLIFDKGDDVTFSIGGYGTVHLTGYQSIDSSNSEGDMDKEHYCPVAEFGSEKKILKSMNIAVNGVKTKNKGKALMGDDDEEDDSDFSPGELEREEVEEEYDEVEIDQEELKSILEDQQDDEIEAPLKLEGSQKRKIGRISFSEKSLKKGRLNSDSEDDEKSDVSMEDEESDSDEGGLNSSIGNTPMPKRLNLSAKEKLKMKKIKRLSEISNLDKSVKSENDLTSESKSKPKKKGENKIKQPIVKLEGGVEYQDVVIGRGPAAAPGKIVSVFYMGRLENKEIFDARVPPKKPFNFKLGVPEVIKGLDIGLNDMRVGGQRKLKVPPSMGYGSKGINSVPPNSTLYFTIELVNVN